MFRFLHLGDVHLETAFVCREESSRRLLREDLLEALSRAVDCALSERVHAVLIAGDLLDRQQLSFSTERFLASELERLNQAGIQCLAVSGNHDPGGASSPLRSLPWPPNFHFLDSREPRAVDIKDGAGTLVGRVIGAGHEAPDEELNLASRFPLRPGDVPTVGLLHTLVLSAEGAHQHDRYAPCSTDDLERADYDYWALGHVHRYQRLDGPAEAWYCGCLQGRHPRERGEKGGLLVELAQGGAARVEFRRFAPALWETVVLDDLNQVRGIEDLHGVLRTALADPMNDNPAHWFLRVELRGISPLAGRLRDRLQVDELETELSGRLGLSHLEIDARGLRPEIDAARYRDEPHVLAETLKLIEEAMGDRELRWQLARQLSPPQMNSRETDSYITRLLEGLDAEAIARFLEGADAN